MIVLRDKSWSLPEQEPSQEITSKDLQLEQLRLQRQQRLIQHQKTQLRIKEDMAKSRALAQAQKREAEKDTSEAKDRIRIKQQEQESQGSQNTGLYKTRTKPVAPVSMPK